MTDCPHCREPYLGEEPRSAIYDLAAEFGIDPKRLRGRVYRNGIGDPTGCPHCAKVYRSTVDVATFHASGGVS
jgi:hypothetical protein